jgi:hypothetical protein
MLSNLQFYFHRKEKYPFLRLRLTRELCALFNALDSYHLRPSQCNIRDVW